MKWEEIEYFLAKVHYGGDIKILDIGCGNGRFLGALKNTFPQIQPGNYMGVDLSSGLLDEAKNMHPNFKEVFYEMNMLNVDTLGGEQFDHIFFIASFHHLKSIEEREEVLSKAYALLKRGGRIYMTNWALNSDLNQRKYSKSCIDGSLNSFGSTDYNIKIGGYVRYYHCFSLDELSYLFEKEGYKVIENKLFENQRNFISIIEK